MEDGKRTQAEKGTPQGGSVSPLLANVYLHYVFDLWVHQWRKRHARTVKWIIVRFADDFTVGFQYREDAERFLEELRERFQRFGILNCTPVKDAPDGIRPLCCREPQTASATPVARVFRPFLASHIRVTTTRNGKFIVLRQTMRKRLPVETSRDQNRAEATAAPSGPCSVGQRLRSVMQGHFNYYAVPR